MKKLRRRKMMNEYFCSSHDEHFNCIGETSHHTELDSHANMVVVCKHALEFAHTEKTVEVQPFSPDCETMESVPIVHAVVKWTCPHTDEADTHFSHEKCIACSINVSQFDSSICDERNWNQGQ